MHRVCPGVAALPQVFLCKVCLWCKQEQAHVPEEPLQRARVCSKRGLCTWRGSWVGDSGTIYCSHAWGLNPLCSCSPGISLLTPGPAQSWAVSVSTLPFSRTAAWSGLGHPPAAWPGAACHGAVVPSALPRLLSKRHRCLGPFTAPKGLQPTRGQRGRCCTAGWRGGFSHSPTGALPAAHGARLWGETPRGSLPAPSHPPRLGHTTRPRSTRIPGAAGRPPLLGTQPEIPQRGCEMCGERRAQQSSLRPFPVCTGRCRLDRSFL